jgi:hypothetical protein
MNIPEPAKLQQHKVNILLCGSGIFFFQQRVSFTCFFYFICYCGMEDSGGNSGKGIHTIEDRGGGKERKKERNGKMPQSGTGKADTYTVGFVYVAGIISF